jgi:eukaryotic-like serine/threonine-protein kinase
MNSTLSMQPRTTPESQSDAPLKTREIAARLAILLAPRYLVLKLIAIGGMSSVYLVRHRIHHGLFAVKVLHPALAERPEFLARFRREGLLAARLAGHPNIAPVLDVGEGDGLHYLIMPYIRGEDLDHLLARTGSLRFEDAILAALQVNEALLFAWNNGILHCDLTPGNIRLNEFGQFILVDFGLADISLSAKHPVLPASTVPRAGTPLYMSPERILGHQIDIRSDLYALGAILYELLTGEAAFNATLGTGSVTKSNTGLHRNSPDEDKRGDAGYAGKQTDQIAEIERNHLAAIRPLSRRDRSHPNLRKHPGIQPLLLSLFALSPADRFADPIELRQALRTLVDYPPPPAIQPQTDPNAVSPMPRRRLSFR